MLVFEVPVTVEVNCCEAPARTSAVVGETETVTPGGGFVPPPEPPDVPPQSDATPEISIVAISRARLKEFSSWPGVRSGFNNYFNYGISARAKTTGLKYRWKETLELRAMVARGHGRLQPLLQIRARCQNEASTLTFAVG